MFVDTTNNPKITIAIQGYRNPEMLRLCLQSVVRFGGAQTQVIVADSATQIDTIMLMREEFPQFIFLPHKKNVGFGAMVNTCLRKACGEYVFVLNPDTILEEHTIVDLEKFMDVHRDIGMCGPAQKNFNGKWENTRFAFYKPLTIVYRRTFLSRFSFAQKHLSVFEMRSLQSAVEPYAVPWIIGSAMFVRRSAIEKVGLMDPRFYIYMEDVDWCRRFWENGLKVCYNPGITLFHFYGKGSAKKGFIVNVLFNRLTWIHISSGCKYFLKYAFKPVPEIRSL